MIEISCPSCAELERYRKEAAEEEKQGILPIPGLKLGFRPLDASDLPAVEASTVTE